MQPEHDLVDRVILVPLRVVAYAPPDPTPHPDDTAPNVPTLRCVTLGDYPVVVVLDASDLNSAVIAPPDWSTVTGEP